MAAIGDAMARLGAEPPREVGGVAVTGTTDYRVGAEDRPRWLGPTPLVALTLEDGSRVLVRPSGTEPKLKIYVDVQAPVPEGGNPFALEEGLVREAERVAADLAGFLGF